MNLPLIKCFLSNLDIWLNVSKMASSENTVANSAVGGSEDTEAVVPGSASAVTSGVKSGPVASSAVASGINTSLFDEWEEAVKSNASEIDVRNASYKRKFSGKDILESLDSNQPPSGSVTITVDYVASTFNEKDEVKSDRPIYEDFSLGFRKQNKRKKTSERKENDHALGMEIVYSVAPLSPPANEAKKEEPKWRTEKKLEDMCHADINRYPYLFDPACYKYTWSSTNIGPHCRSIYYNCSEGRNGDDKCKARLIIQQDVDLGSTSIRVKKSRTTIEVTKEMLPELHNHESTKEQNLVDHEVNTKTSAAIINKNPVMPKVLQGQVANKFREEQMLSMMRIPTTTTISKKLNTNAKKNKKWPEPKTPKEYLAVPEEIRYFENGEKFLRESGYLQLDDDVNTKEPYLIFASDKGLERLKTSEKWSVDGTFKKKTVNDFSQLFSVGAVVDDKHVLVSVYAFVPYKNAAQYEWLLRWIIQKIGGLIPKYMLTDYEPGILSVAKILGVIIEGCYFHWMCSINRNLDHLHLRPLYQTNQTFKQVVKKILVLAFIPENSVKLAWESIENDFANVLKTLTEQYEPTKVKNVQDFSKYIKRTYISGEDDNPPMFSIEYWNKFKVFRDKKCATNNAIEAYHTHLHQATVKQPGFFKTCEILQGFDGATTLKALNLAADTERDTHPTRTRNQEERNQLRSEAVQRYAEDENLIVLMGALERSHDLNLACR